MSALVLRGDARALPLMSASVDCVVTSPPYNVGMLYEGVPDTLAPDEYKTRVRGWAAEMFRVLKPGRRCWVNVVPSATHDDHERPAGWHSGRTKAPRLPLLHIWSCALEGAGFTLIDIAAWARIGNNSTAWGSYESPASPNLRGDWEAVIIVCKGEWARETPIEWRGWKDGVGEWQRLVSTVWKFNPAQRNGHPCPFPIDLAKACIRLSTWPAELILDPFVGSGSALRAAHELGRDAVGIELSEVYCRRAEAVGYQGSLL